MVDKTRTCIWHFQLTGVCSQWLLGSAGILQNRKDLEVLLIHSGAQVSRALVLFICDVHKQTSSFLDTCKLHSQRKVYKERWNVVCYVREMKCWLSPQTGDDTTSKSRLLGSSALQHLLSGSSPLHLLQPTTGTMALRNITHFLSNSAQASHYSCFTLIFVPLA